MASKSTVRSARQQRRVKKQVQKMVKKADSMVFFNLLTSPQLLEPLEELLPEFRERLYPPTMTLAMFLGQVLSADGSCQNAVNEAIVNRMLRGVPAGSANTGAYCEARKRLSPELARKLSRQTAALVNAHTPQEWLWRSRHVKLVDGTTILMPDTAENQARFPQHGQQETGAGHGLFRELLQCFVEGDVMLADSYYCGFFLIAGLVALGVEFAFEQHGARNTDFRAGKKLGSRDHIVTWSKPKVRPAWMTVEEYQNYPDELTVRETKVRNKVLVTSFLKPRELSKRDLGRLFLSRWNVELDLRNIKETLGMGRLVCKTTQMCEKELGVCMLAYNLIRLLMAEAAVQADVLPRQLSFKHTVQVWIAWSQRQFLSDAPEQMTALFKLIAHVRVGNRPGRIEPRTLKQRPKPFPRLHSTRRRARRNIRLYGHAQKLRA